jgi:tRNA pseudouridine55 synthase
VVLYDKAAGITSHDAVASVRRSLDKRVKVGHAGTLDPFATGLLLMLIGRATRGQRFLMELPKTYEVIAQFGWVSSTGDVDGELTETGVMPPADLTLPTGALRQRPPAYSAVKVGGRRAYALARAGEEVTLPEREVHVYRFDERWRSGDRRAYVIECGSGTYVRSLIADLGDAYCVELRRTRIGPFSVEDACADLADDSCVPVVPLADALSFLPSVTLSGEDARRAAHGVPVNDPRTRAQSGAAVRSGGRGATGGGGQSTDAGEVVRLLDDQGLIGLGRSDPASGVLRTIVGLRAAARSR